MPLSTRGRVVATTSTTAATAGVALGWGRGRGVLGGLIGAMFGGLAGLLAGQAVANATDLPPGLLVSGPDQDAPEKPAVDGSEGEGFVSPAQRGYYDLVHDAKVAAEDKFAPIAFVRTMPAPTMGSLPSSALLRIPVPFVPHKAELPESAAAIVAKLWEIKARYGATITAASMLSNVPEELIYAIIFKESRGDAGAMNPTSQATGLMQIFPMTANGFIVKENVAGKLTAAEKQVLRRFLGDRLDPILAQKFDGDTAPKGMKGKKWLVTRQDLLNPEFNVHVGAIGLSHVIRRHKQPDGLVRLDRAWVHFGLGMYKKLPAAGIPDTLTWLKSIGWGTYFTNLTGAEGVLDLVVANGIAEHKGIISTV